MASPLLRTLLLVSTVGASAACDLVSGRGKAPHAADTASADDSTHTGCDTVEGCGADTAPAGDPPEWCASVDQADTVTLTEGGRERLYLQLIATEADDPRDPSLVSSGLVLLTFLGDGVSIIMAPDSTGFFQVGLGTGDWTAEAYTYSGSTSCPSKISFSMAEDANTLVCLGVACP